MSAIAANFTPAPFYLFLTPPVVASCFFYPITPFEVSKIIKGLKNKGNRLLDIHPSVIKDNMNIFSDHMTTLYNFSLVESGFPDKAKTGRVNPVHKSGRTDCIDNFRPISVLPIFSKVFEKLTLIRMEGFISRFDILSPCQFGFRSGRGTTQAITKLLSCMHTSSIPLQNILCLFLS